MCNMEPTFNPRELITNFANDNKDVEALQFIRDDPEGVEITLIVGQGVVNYVYRVKSGTSSLIIKYGEESFRMMSSEKLSLERQTVEYDCLQLMQKVQPGSAPVPYCHDKSYNIIAMADMSDWDLLGAQLERRYVDLEAATSLGQLLGKLHLETSRDNIAEDEWQGLVEKFRKPDLMQYVQGYSFERPLVETDPINSIPASLLDDYRQCIKQIKLLRLDEKLSNTFNTEKCFIHGDCHYKSIFTKEGKVALFDFELSFLGHPAYNVAFPIASYILCYILDESYTTRKPEVLSKGPSTETVRTLSIQAIRNMVAGYMETHVNLADHEAYFASFLSTLAAFTGFMTFALSLFASLADVCEGAKEEDRAAIMHAGFKLLESHDKITTLDQLMDSISLAHPGTGK